MQLEYAVRTLDDVQRDPRFEAMAAAQLRRQDQSAFGADDGKRFGCRHGALLPCDAGRDGADLR
jgi:hypothetical protein